MGLNIEFTKDDVSNFRNILPYDMYVGGERTFAWMCYYVNSKDWRFKGNSPTFDSPRRATRAEAEADAIAWWAAKQLEET